MNNKLIICGGDSFVAGDELAGDLIMPGYTSNIYTTKVFDSDKRNAILTEFRDKEATARKSNLYQVYLDECKLRAWPEKLKKHTPAKIINCAKGGISNEEICHRIIETYHSNSQYKNITVIIFPTSTFRFGFPMYDTTYGGEYQFVSYTISHGANPNGIIPKTMQPIYDFFLTRSDWDNVWKSYSYLMGCKIYLESLGVEVIFADSGMWGNSFKEFSGSNYHRLEQIKSLLPIKIKLPIAVVNPSLPGFHYIEELHDNFAKRLAEYLSNHSANWQDDV